MRAYAKLVVLWGIYTKLCGAEGYRVGGFESPVFVCDKCCSGFI